VWTVGKASTKGHPINSLTSSDIAQRVTGKDIGQLITETVIVPPKLHGRSYPTGTGIPGPLHGYGWDPVTEQFDDKTLLNPPLAGAAEQSSPAFQICRRFHGRYARAGC
jgi:hypothetical protein